MISTLYVDDEPDLLEIGKIYLERTGEFKVRTVTSAQEAMKIIPSEKYDAIISDYQMPDMNGIDFLKQVRASGNPVPFIIFTGRGREEVVIQALNEGADFYIQKGGDPGSQFTELAHKVRQAVLKKQAEASILDLERREADIINFLPDATFAIDTHGIVIAWNRAIEKMTGVASGDIVGKGNYEYALPFYHERRPVLIDLVINDDPEIASKYPVIRRDGKTLVSEIVIPHFNNGKGAALWFTASPLYDTLGNIVGAIESVRDITERKRAEEALNESEQRFRGMAERSSDLIFILDKEMSPLYVSPSARTIIGYDPEELFGKQREFAAETIFSKCCCEFMNALQENRNGASVENLEMQLKKKDGNTVYVNVHAIPVLHDGIFAGAQVVMRDITAGKKAEKALLESDERYRSLSEASNDLIFVIDKNDRVSYVNNSAAEMMGLPAKEIVGMERSMLFPPDISRGQQKAITYIFKTGKGFRSTGALIFKGRKFWFDHYLVPVRDASGTITQVLGISRDVTEQKNAEEELRTRTEELDNRNRIISTLIDTVPIGIFMVEAPSGKPILANREAARLLGLSILPDVSEKSLTEVYRAFQAGWSAQYPVEQMPVVHGMQGDTSHINDMEIVLPDGSIRHLEVFGTPVFDRQDHVTGSLVSFLDITWRKQEEQTLKETNKKLNLMNSITRHDMANQVTLIKGYAELATDRTSDPDILDFLSRIDSAGQMITKMIEFTKIYEKLGANVPGWYNVGSIVAHHDPGDISLTCTCTTIEIFADPMLEKVIFTLVENAIRHGEHVTGISVRCEHIPEGLCIIVEDDGAGIPPESKELIFEKGYGRNTGYGLFLAREILAITGISIRETGVPGKGARFELHVPEGKYRSTQ